MSLRVHTLPIMFSSERKDDSLRFCLDFRKRNSRTIRDFYNLPRIDDTIDTLIGAYYFSKLVVGIGRLR